MPVGLGDGSFRVPLFRRPGERIVIVGRGPLPGEAVIGGGRTGIRGWPTTGSRVRFPEDRLGLLRVHHHQRGAAAVLALVPLFPPLLPAPSLPSRPAPMPLTLAALLVTGPRAAAPRQFLLGGRGNRLAVDLDDQYVAIIRGQWTFAQIDISGPSPGPTPQSPRPAVPPPETSPRIRWRSGSSPAWPTGRTTR